jgi:7,8-dihydropterin-6-yl-methyl-4-(beta-D-ribofuranosyl)aminobenzene 5'-phosphate synthase
MKIILIGGAGAKRIEVAATAITAGMTLDDVPNLDPSYAPPYAPTMDNLITAANVARNKRDGYMVEVSAESVQHKPDAGEDFVFLDVRSPQEHAQVRLPKSMLIPLRALRKKLSELPKDKEIITFCAISLRGHETSLILRAAGFANVKVLDGGAAMWPYEKEMQSMALETESQKGSARIRQVEAVRIWILTDNYYDALRPDHAIVKRYRVRPGDSIHAEHGLAYFVETVVDGQISTCVFDFGLDPHGIINNAKLLNIDLGRADAFVLSHGHFDHWTGAIEVLRQNPGCAEKGMQFFVGEEAFLPRYSRRSGTDELMDLGRLDGQAIQESGVRVTEVTAPTRIMPGCYSTGKIERVTAYESVAPGLLVERNGKIQLDDFRGEQALFFDIKGKGLVVLSGCAHAGIVNTIKQAQKVAGTEKVHAILGGFHLTGAKPEIIQKTVSDIKGIGPDFLAPAHCTGFEAMVAFSQAMPKEFILNTAGTQYTFSAS